MGQLMAGDAEISFGSHAGVCIAEPPLVRHLNMICGRPVVGHVAAMPDVSAGCLDEGIGPGMPFERWDDRQGVCLGCEAVDLRDIDTHDALATRRVPSSLSSSWFGSTSNCL